VTPPAGTRLVAAFSVLVLIWGTTWAVIRVGLGGIPPFTGVALRFTIAGLLLLALARRFGVRLRPGRRERWLWLTNGVLSFSVSYSVVYWAEQYIPSGLAAVLFATYPLLVAPLAHVLLPAERLRPASTLGLLLGFSGVAVIFSDDLRLLGGGHVLTAALVMLLSPFVSAVSTVVIKRWGHDVHPLSLGAVPMLIGGIATGAIALAFERDRPLVFDVRSVGALLYLAVLGSGVTFTVYYWLLARTTATRVALISYLIPVVAVAIGAVAFGEPVRPRLLAGAALVLAGVAAVNRAHST
jgi:drug/metabolite transporter (DMT)-like permease